MPQNWYDFNEARKHKTAWRGVWASVIWVDDAGENELAVLHWMGGTNKVVGRYKADDRDAAIAHAERCSNSGYCPSALGDNAEYLAELKARNKY